MLVISICVDLICKMCAMFVTSSKYINSAFIVYLFQMGSSMLAL
jgi:hypothetical protein